ncbi:hypothetical protein GCM10010287_13560 [Streptomyces variabilis]|uniref:Uncharacterized protein n=1 Tax=Streptomyces variabilis TaxID=67372 RepID=A0ABQ2TUU1_9ACTN|nr:hypothetical protein GCM10010265_24750 [Streptomyces griseoincarnatus]GGT41967.1 hypothetical protein GCM10010287_13560 [Streptomyces variabilis]
MTSRLVPTAARISKARRQGGADRRPGQGQVDGAGRVPGPPLLCLAHVEQYGGAVAGAGAGMLGGEAAGATAEEEHGGAVALRERMG